MFNCCLRFNRLWNHPPQQNFKSHGVGAAMMRHEEFAVTSIDTVLKRYVMIVIITVKCNVKFVEEEAVPLLSIPFCFFSFSYHSVVHL